LRLTKDSKNQTGAYMIDFEKIMEFECSQPENRFGKDFLNEHILLMRKISLEIAELFNADFAVVEAAAWLHDIAAVRNFSKLANHHIDATEIAGSILSENNYSKEMIDKICLSIKTHSSPVKLGQGLIEQVCISNGDALSQIINPSYWFFYAFNVREMDYQVGKEWYSQRIESHWNNLIDEIKPKYKKDYEHSRMILDKKFF
jgi:hypothetical protein